jgi:predicted DNA-binding antitoxin AbrB/MazE fold protein
MSKSLRAIIREGKIEPLEEVNLPEGSKVLVTLLADDKTEFWFQASQASIDTIWDNSEDDVYAQLLKESYRLSALPLFRLVRCEDQNVFAVSGRQLARRDSSCLTARVRITESAMKMATPTKTTSTL